MVTLRILREVLRNVRMIVGILGAGVTSGDFFSQRMISRDLPSLNQNFGKSGLIFKIRLREDSQRNAFCTIMEISILCGMHYYTTFVKILH